MTLHGVAVPTDVLTAPSPADLYPIAAVRSVALRSDDFYRYQDHLTAAGIHRACVVTTESLGANPEGWAAAMAELLDNVVPSWWFVGNEQDAGYLAAHSHASDRKDPPVYARFWDAVVPQIRARQPGVPIVTGGFVSGSPEVLMDYAEFCHEADLVNVHPWGKTAAETSLLLASLREALGRPMRFLIGEWNRPAAEIAGYIKMLQTERVEVAFYFSFHTFDVPGLTDHLGQKTDRYYAFIEALNAPEPEAGMGKLEEAQSQDWWVLGRVWDDDGPMDTEEIETKSGRVIRMRGHEHGVGIELPSGTVYQPGEATQTSYVENFRRVLLKDPETFKQIFRDAGFRVVPE